MWGSKLEYWWVNHKKSYRYERDGGYLWSPKVQSDGKKSHFYDNMRKVRAGDIIVSLANARVSDIGVATSEAVSAAVPDPDRAVDEAWDKDNGWLLPVAWMRVASPMRPIDNIKELRPHLRDKYAPIKVATGGGNQGAYLCNIDQTLFEVVLAKASDDGDRENIEKFVSSIVPQQPESAADDTISKKIDEDANLSATEKERLQKARYGQGKFREDLIQIEPRCRLTGVENLSYLIASHIKAWRHCITSHERLDGNNGLLLTPNADKLFDKHLISFENDGAVLVSEKVTDDELVRLGLAGLRNRNAGAFTPEQAHYLEFHRKLFSAAEK